MHARTRAPNILGQLNNSMPARAYSYTATTVCLFFCGIGSDHLRIDRHLHVCTRTIATFFGESERARAPATSWPARLISTAVARRCMHQQSVSGPVRARDPCQCQRCRARVVATRDGDWTDAHRGAVGSQRNELNATTSLDRLLYLRQCPCTPIRVTGERCPWKVVWLGLFYP